MSRNYPPLGFHFIVEFANFLGEFQFKEVSGLSVELETEQISEGGENRFKHKLPVKTKYPNLALKRGVLVNSAKKGLIISQTATSVFIIKTF